VQVRELKSKQDIAALSEPVVINCTGLGSRELMGDEQLIPIKGQLTVLLPQPEIDYTVLEDHYYMFPRRDGILLGGTFERDQWDMSPDREAEKKVIEAHQRIFTPLLGQ
jgi:glycine/D-amino acid oxidase-like deaminating enzyme